MHRLSKRAALIGFLMSIGLLVATRHAGASTNFVQAYLDANGGCRGAQSPLAFVLSGSGTASPFGKAAEEWTEGDLATMKSTLEQCVRVAETTGRSSPEMRGDLATINSRVPILIDRAKQAQSARSKYESDEAAKRERQREAIAKFNELQKKVWAETQERLRAPRAAVDPCTAGVPSPYANLGPNGAAVRERFDRAVAVCRRRMKEQAIAQNRIQEELAQRRERERIATLEAEEGHKAYLAEHNLTEVSVVDLQANGAHMIDKRVAVTGFVKVFNEDKIVIYSHPSDISGVPLDLTTASPSARRLIFANCSDMYRDCRIEIDGVVGFDDHVFVKVM